MAAITVNSVIAEGSDLSAVASCQLPVAGFDEYHSELGPDSISLRKKRHDLVGSGIRSHVVVGRLASQQQIAHTSADKINLEAALAQRTHTFNHRTSPPRHTY